MVRKDEKGAVLIDLWVGDVKICEDRMKVSEEKVKTTEGESQQAGRLRDLCLTNATRLVATGVTLFYQTRLLCIGGWFGWRSQSGNSDEQTPDALSRTRI